MSEIRDKARGEIAQHIYDAVFPGADWDEPSEYEKEPFYDRASQLLSIPELAIVDRDAELPPIIVRDAEGQSDGLDEFGRGQIDGQRRMLNEGWIKEVKE